MVQVMQSSGYPLQRRQDPRVVSTIGNLFLFKHTGMCEGPPGGGGGGCLLTNSRLSYDLFAATISVATEVTQSKNHQPSLQE